MKYINHHSRSEFSNWLSWAKMKVLRDSLPTGGCRGECISLLHSASGRCCLPWLVPLFHLHSHKTSISKFLSDLDPYFATSSTFKDVWGSIGPTWIVQDKLLKVRWVTVLIPSATLMPFVTYDNIYGSLKIRIQASLGAHVSVILGASQYF